MKGPERRPHESAPQSLRALVLAIPLIFGTPAAEASDADRELAGIARLGPACSALVADAVGGDITSCKRELAKTAERIKTFAAKGSFAHTDLLAGRISNAELCSRAVALLDEQKKEIEEVVEYLALLLKADGSDIVSTKLAAKTVADIRKLRGTADPESYKAHVAGKLVEARAKLASCGFGLRAVLSMGGLSMARTEIQDKLPPLLDQMIADIGKSDEVEKLKAATVALVNMLDILRAAAEKGAR